MSYTSFCACARRAGTPGRTEIRGVRARSVCHYLIPALLVLEMLGCVRRPGIEPGVSRVSGERRDRLARGGWSTRQVPPLVPPVCRTGALLVSYASYVAREEVGPTRVELITSGVSGRRSSS